LAAKFKLGSQVAKLKNLAKETNRACFKTWYLLQMYKEQERIELKGMGLPPAKHNTTHTQPILPNAIIVD
jgi:hypothetical protein